MNCQDALSLLYDVIDKEASEIDVKEVQKHLDCCQDCLKKFKVEETLQQIVKERLKAVSDIPKIDLLKSKVLSRLEEMDVKHTQSSGQSFPFRLPAVALASAAAVILLFGAGYWGKKLYDHYIEYIPIEKAHWAAEADNDGFTDEVVTQSLVAEVSNDYGVSIANSVSGFSLVGARKQEIKGFTVPQFKFADGNNKVISAFVFPANGYAIPDNLLETRVEIDGQCHFSHNCRGCWLVYHKLGNAMIVTATTDHTFQLLEFKPANATGAI